MITGHRENSSGQAEATGAGSPGPGLTRIGHEAELTAEGALTETGGEGQRRVSWQRAEAGDS